MDESETIETNKIYHLLRNKRRRAVLFYLLYNEETVSLKELSRIIAGWEFNKSPEEVTSKEKDKVYISLHQTHLPTLDKENIIKYNTERKTVSVGDKMKELEQFIDPQKTSESVESLMGEKYHTIYAGLQEEKIKPSKKARVLDILTPKITKNEGWSHYYLILSFASALFIVYSVYVSINLLIPAVANTLVLASVAFIHSFVEAEPKEIATAEEMFLGSLRPEWAEE